MNIQAFCESAEVYAVNSSVWLVDGDNLLATHCSDVTFNKSEWDAVYRPNTPEISRVSERQELA
jgi:hypothetical protein